MIEIAMIDFSSIHLKPSYLAMSALYLAKKILKNPKPWSSELAKETLYTEKNVSSLSWVLLNLLKSYQKPNTQLHGLKKKFSTDHFSKVSTYFQFETSTGTSQKHTERKNDSKSNDGTTTDKKRHISADKFHHQSQKTLSSTKATSTKKCFQFNQNKLA